MEIEQAIEWLRNHYQQTAQVTQDHGWFAEFTAALTAIQSHYELTAAAQEDRERLDWLESQGVRKIYYGPHPHSASEKEISPGSMNIRAAIDAAARSQKGGPDAADKD